MSMAISVGETSVVERERRSPRARDRERVLEEMEQRGKSVEEVASETGLSIWTLKRWRTDARRGKSGEVKAQSGLLCVPKPVAMEVGSMEVMLGNEMRGWLAAVRWVEDHAVAEVLGLDHFVEDDLYAALDWLQANQSRIDRALATKVERGAAYLFQHRRHLSRP